MGSSGRARRQDAGPPAEGGPQDAEGCERLVRLASRGDQDAWRALVELYGRRVFALAKSRVRRADVAEEVTQSVFLTVATKLTEGSYEERGRFESWLFRVAMNRVRDEIRRARRRHEGEDNGTISRVVADERTAGPERWETDRLRSAIEELGDADREVIELRHHGQVAFKEIAAMLDEPVGTVLARHHRALGKLRAILERDEASLGKHDG